MIFGINAAPSFRNSLLGSAEARVIISAYLSVAVLNVRFCAVIVAS